MNIHPLRTFIINAITLTVATGFALNVRRNRDIPVKPWPLDREAPPVEIIVPARNEEHNLPGLLASLLAQGYPDRRWSVTVVDDASDDRSLDIANALAAYHPNLRVVSAPSPPPGWTGKNRAMYTGYRASNPDAEWLLFVDADTRHAPEMLSSVVQRAGEIGADLLSLVPCVEMRTFWERLLVPQAGELYTLLVGTMDNVNRRDGNAAANGQCMLVRRALYAEIGALPEVIADVAEDRALATACKARGHSVRLEYGRQLVTARDYSSLGEIWAGYSKTIFWASGRNLSRALVVALALALYALLPPLALIFTLARGNRAARRQAAVHGVMQIAPMLALRMAVCRRLGVPLRYAFAYPLGVAVGDALLLFSVYRVVSGTGVRWKGRVYK